MPLGTPAAPLLQRRRSRSCRRAQDSSCSFILRRVALFRVARRFEVDSPKSRSWLRCTFAWQTLAGFAWQTLFHSTITALPVCATAADTACRELPEERFF